MTALEWLVEQITDGTMSTREAIAKAKEMEKHGLKEAFKQGVIECGFENSAEDWANEWIDNQKTNV